MARRIPTPSFPLSETLAQPSFPRKEESRGGAAGWRELLHFHDPRPPRGGTQRSPKVGIHPALHSPNQAAWTFETTSGCALPLMSATHTPTIVIAALLRSPFSRERE